MYDEFSKKGGHSTEWVEIVKDFLNQAFAGGHCVVKCPCKICQNYKFLTQDEVQVHLCKKKFMSNYLMWRDHGEVKMPAIGIESDGNEDEDQMDEMITKIGREYKVDSGEQASPSEVQNFYTLVVASDEKVHDGTDMIVLQTMICLMAIKLKYNFSNQYYNDIVKVIIDFIPMKHNMIKDLYLSKKIVVGVSMNYEKINVYEERKKNCIKNNI
jgi:hypothetical protein